MARHTPVHDMFGIPSGTSTDWGLRTPLRTLY